MGEGVSFAAVARRYDALNRLMSLGRDLHWRRLAAAAMSPAPGDRVLDVGVGTGDMALALLRRQPEAAVVGLDLSEEMMRLGREKPGGAAIRLVRGDGLRLPFPDTTFDGVVSAFLLRNVPDPLAALSEQRRVLRPGGRLVCLEMTWPRSPLFSALFRLYFFGIVPPLAGALSGQRAAYRYLPRSVERFMGPEELKAALERVGVTGVRYRMLMGGSVALHVGTRPS